MAGENKALNQQLVLIDVIIRDANNLRDKLNEKSPLSSISDERRITTGLKIVGNKLRNLERIAG